MTPMEKTGKNMEKTLIISMKKETGKGDGKNPVEITPQNWGGYFSQGFFSLPSLSPFVG